jgi:hypothetical protein
MRQRLVRAVNARRLPAGLGSAVCFVPCVCLAVLFGCGAARPAATPLQRAQQAFASHRFAAAVAAYQAVVAAGGEPAGRIEAARRLASIAWRVNEDPVAAERALAMLAEIPGGRVPAAVERSRMLAARSDFAGARAAAATAMSQAQGAIERGGAVIAWAHAAVEPEVRARLEDGAATPGPPAAPPREVAEAADRLSLEVAEQPGDLAPARLLAVAAALVGDGPALLRAWESYYLLEPAGPGDLLAAARGTVGDLLPRWDGRESPAERSRLVGALAASRFFDAAAVIALAPAPGAPPVARSDARAAEIVEYARVLRQVERLTDAYYRRTAVGKGDAEAWRRELEAVAARLWPLLAWSGAPPPFSMERVELELEARFGAVIKLGETAGYADLHMGHRVVDERRAVEQYGCQAQLRFVALDGMVSNGFQSWAWDGGSAHGGWAEKGLIVQVRPVYAGGPLRAWRRLEDPVERARWDAEVAAAAAGDETAAAAAAVVYLPGVAERIERDAIQALRDELAAGGLAGRELEQAFVREHYRAIREQSIFAHEGRHAIDRELGLDPSGEELEFRAKCSEVVFAPRPFLGLRSIFAPNLGDRTPHGQANERLVRGLVRYLERHAGEAGLESGRPLLLQLERLDEARLKAAFRTLDPLAAKGGCGG